MAVLATVWAPELQHCHDQFNKFAGLVQRVLSNFADVPLEVVDEARARMGV
jgi:hypothetical protein